jgi:hypothetical protein
MPNNVTNKLVLPIAMADEVIAVIAPDGKVDFKTLIPEPPHLYHGNLTNDDERDFPLNWNSWNRENWGTKWNAYDTVITRDEAHAYVEFDTAWSLPYPFIAAINNRWPTMEFEHRYFDEGHNYWGKEVWEKCPFADGKVVRHPHSRKSLPEDKQALCIELKGYDPAEDDAADAAAVEAEES